MKRKTIGILSRECGVKVTTIRYYESIGLTRKPKRSNSGQRIYDATAVERLNFIRHARDLGFPIDAIRELISLQDRPGTDCKKVCEIARRQRDDVRLRLRRLETLEAELERMISICDGGVISDCQVLASLSDHEKCLHEHNSATIFKPVQL